MVCTDARRGRLRLTALSSMVPTPPTLTLVPTPTASKPLLDGAMMILWSRPPSTEHGQAQKRIRRTNNENGRFFSPPIFFFEKVGRFLPTFSQNNDFVTCKKPVSSVYM